MGKLSGESTMEQPDTVVLWGGQAGDGHPITLVDLLRMARDLDETLIQVQPSSEFRAALYDDLLLSARRQAAQRALSGDLDIGTPPEPYGLTDFNEGRTSRRLVWGAAAVGLSSAVSVISAMAAYYWRRRHDKAA